MIREHANLFRRVTMGLDILLGIIAFFAAYYVRARWATGLEPIRNYILILPELLAIWSILLYGFGIYASLRLKSFWDIFKIIFKVSLIGFLLFGSLYYMLKLEHISRSFIVLASLFMAVLIFIEKVSLIIFFRNLRAKGFNFRSILVVGSGKRAQKFIRNVQEHPEYGLKIVGVVDDLALPTGNSEGMPFLGKIKDIPKILKNTAVDHIFFVVPRSMMSKIEPSIQHCEIVGIPVSVAVDLFDLQYTMGKESCMLGFPLITFQLTTDKVGQLLFKRVFDVIACTIGLFLISPIYLVVTLLIKITSQGPVYFVQERCGLNGRRFKMYKFRTMVVDAEAKLAELMAHNEVSGPAFKMSNDPRVTPIGKFLRKTSIDELPQLWNVLKGDMSLVGPRPPLAKEVNQYDNWHRRRLSMRPGLTCLWQISGRNNITDFDEWMRLDLEYIDHWSFIQDIRILIKTVPVVVLGAGAK